MDLGDYNSVTDGHDLGLGLRGYVIDLLDSSGFDCHVAAVPANFDFGFMPNSITGGEAYDDRIN